MSESLHDLLAPGGRRAEPRIAGVVTGVVTNNQDPEGLGRVKVRFPWLSDDDETWWARVVAPAAAGGTGVYFLPDVDDEVLVAFEHGDIRFPYVLGSVWNSRAKPPDSNEDGKNAKRIVQTPAGHVVRLDDTQGGEKIEVIVAGGDGKVVIEKTGNVTIEATGDVKITTSGGRLTLSGSKGVEISSDGSISVKGSGDVLVQASSKLTLKGGTVEIN